MDGKDKPPPYDATNYNTQYGLPRKQEEIKPPSYNPPVVPPITMVTTTPSSEKGMTVVYSVPVKRIFSRHPTSITCMHCNSNVVTQPRAEIGAVTWIAFVAMILMGLWCGCCLIPFCFDEFKDIFHNCPNCHKTIDVYKPL